MKKWMPFIAVFLCLVLLSACGEEKTIEPSPPEETSVPADPRTLTEPPELVVSTMYDGDHVTAVCGNFEWTEIMPDGTASTVIACGLHPLDEIETRATLYTAFPAGVLPEPAEGEFQSTILPVYYLDFGDIPPETITVHRWPSEYIGQAIEHSADSEEVTVDRTDGIALLPLGDGEFVYEVRADWGEVGSANYVFNTIPQVRE